MSEYTEVDGWKRQNEDRKGHKKMWGERIEVPKFYDAAKFRAMHGISGAN